MPAPAARITLTPSACLPAPGSASSGPAGSPARPTTPPDTEPQPPSPNELLANLPPEVDTGGVIARGGLAVRAQRVALVDPFAGCPDGVAAARSGQLDHASALLAGAAVDLAARIRRGDPAGRDRRWRVGGGRVEPGVRERAERLGQGDDLGGQLDAGRGAGHGAVEAEPGGSFGEGALVPGGAVVG